MFVGELPTMFPTDIANWSVRNITCLQKLNTVCSTLQAVVDSNCFACNTLPVGVECECAQPQNCETTGSASTYTETYTSTTTIHPMSMLVSSSVNSTTTATGARAHGTTVATNDSPTKFADSTANATELISTSRIVANHDTTTVDNRGLVAAIAGGGGGLLLLISIGVAIACVFRRRRSVKADAPTQMPTVGEPTESESSRTHNYAAFPASVASESAENANTYDLVQVRQSEYESPQSPLN